MADQQSFKWLNKKWVQSSEGFEVGPAAQDAFEYRETDRSMRLEGEFLFGGLEGRGFGFAFYSTWRSARWQQPHEWDDITSADRMRIRSNLMEAFAFMNAKAVFD